MQMVLEFLSEHWDKLATLVTLVLVVFAYWKARNLWKSRSFINRINFSLNYIEDNTLTQEDVTIMDKSTSSMTNYYYGMGWMVNDNLQIDLMGFSDLTDLANWRLSATFLFD